MNRIISLFLLLFTLIPLSAQTVYISSPIYLGSILIDEPDTAIMARTCRQYNLTEQPSEGDYKVFTYNDGTKFRFKVENTDKGNLPTVEVETAETPSAIKKMLSTTGFTKTTGGYEKGSPFTHRMTKCRLSTHSTPHIIHYTKFFPNTSF